MRNIIIILFISARVFSQTIYTFAGTGYMGQSGDGGPANLAQIGNPYGICTDNSGNLYFINSHWVSKVNSSGIISTIAGSTLTFGYSGDGGPALGAELSNPRGIAIDGSGNIYIADSGNNRIRKISSSGTITTIAGTGAYGFSGDGGPATAAEIVVPQSITVDASGNIYFTDNGNGRIRMINSSGIINTIAGTGTVGFSGDGGLATLAQISNPTGIAVDVAGNIYFADNATRIRKINSSGIISTLAGNGTYANSGDGGPATSAMISASNLAIDLSGNIYITTSGPIRKVNTAGIISSIAGTATPGYSGDGGPAISAQIWGVSGIALDANNNYYFGQVGMAGYYQCIRVVCQNACLSGISENSRSNVLIKLSPNPARENLKFERGDDEFAFKEIQIYNSLGQIILELPYSNSINISSLSSGYYTVRLGSDNKIFYSNFIKE